MIDVARPYESVPRHRYAVQMLSSAMKVGDMRGSRSICRGYGANSSLQEAGLGVEKPTEESWQAVSGIVKNLFQPGIAHVVRHLRKITFFH